MISSGPYPGLRPYEREESSIFFGREELCNELLDKLSVTRFLPIVGPSGCGKSSLVRAGMLADLRIGFMPGSKDHWKVAEMRPGDQPFKNLADSLQKKSAFGHEVNISLDRLRSGLGEFIDVMEEVGFPENTNLLLLVDQFEELFRYRSGGTSNRRGAIESSRDEADTFVSLLLALSEQQVLPIYVVITMRTDFIGDCAKFNRLPEAINRGLFLVPRLTKLQLQRAIVEPARVFDCEVEDGLVNRLLRDVGTDPDDLPLMQHVLMRIYNQAEDKKLTYQKYVDVGGFDSALSEHANEAYNQLTEEQKPIAEKLFRCLSTREIDHGRDTRRPTKLGEIAEVCIEEPAEDKEKKKVQLKKILEDLTDIVDVFRQPRYSFITPLVSKEKKLESDTILDISHESLIRQWKPTLEEWIKAETKSASDYFQLEKNAKRWKKEGKKTKWLEPMPYLQISLDWKKRENPTPAWAERYKFLDKEEKNFDLAMEFLEESENAFKRKKIAEEQAEEKEQQLKIKQARLEAELEKELIAKEAKTKLEKARKFKYSLIVITLFLIIIAIAATYFFADRMFWVRLKAGNAFVSEKNYDEAINHFRKAFFWDDDNLDVYISLGTALAYKGKNREAIHIFEKGMKIDPDSHILNLLIGKTYIKLERENEAVEHFKTAIAINPLVIEKPVYMIVLNSLLKPKNGKEDIKDYIEAIGLAPHMVPMDVHDKVINSLINEGKNSEADRYKKIKEKAIITASHEKFAELIERGYELFDAGENKEAIREFKKAIEIEPEEADSKVYITVGYALLKTQKDEEAIVYFEKAISKDPKGVKSGDYIAVGNALLNKDKVKEAIKHFKKAIEIDPEKVNADVYTIVGFDLLKTGKVDEAIKHFKKAIEIDPEKVSVRVYTIVGYDLLKTGKVDEAIEAIKHFKKAIEIDPEKVKADVYTIVGYDSLKAGKLNEAIALFKNALNLMKKNPSKGNASDIDEFKTNIKTKLTQGGVKEDDISKFLENVGFDL